MCDTGKAAPVAGPNTEGDAEHGRPEKQQEEEMEKEAEAEAKVEGGQHAGSPVQVEPERRRPSSPDDRDVQEVTSASQLELVQGRETPTSGERKQSAGMHANQQSQERGAVSGPCLAERYLHMCLPTTCSSPVRNREWHVEEPRGAGPFYFFGGSNGAVIVSSYCESRGWKRIYNSLREDFKLKWCETKSAATYRNFREGEQLIFQNPNNKVLTTKIGLLSSLREYERVSSKVNHGQGLRRLQMEEFIPTTFRMDVREEREAFFALQEGVSRSRGAHGGMWICKPSSLNQGRGIFLLKNKEEVAAFRTKLQDVEDSKAYRKPHQRQQARIIQHYIHNPLLLMGKKFDVRSYLLIACTAPHMVFFRHGYVRLTCDPYDPYSSNLSAHLTNQYMQKKNPLYSQLKEDTVWSMESFNAYVNDRFQVAKGLPRDWVLGVFAKRMQNIMKQCFLAAKSKFDCRRGFFDLIGCDFMVDEDFKVWLLEMNANPALHVNCKVLNEVIPSTVVESLDITLEIFNKRRMGKRVLPLTSQREFVPLYIGCSPPTFMTARKELSRKICKQSQKPPPTMCKSGMEGKVVPSGSLNDSLNVSGGRGQRPTATSSVTTPLVHRMPVQGPPPVSCSSRSQTFRTESPCPRLEIRPSKCTLHYDPMTADDLMLLIPRSKPIIVSPPSPAPVPTDGTSTEFEHKKQGETRTAEKTQRAELQKEEH